MNNAVPPLTPEEFTRNFAEIHPPFTRQEAVVEANRCLFCFDAPCTRACPTHIDVPGFIRQILHRDTLGAAQTILKAKPEYVVSTSEFSDVKARLYSLHNRRKVEKGKDDPSRPTLRRAPGGGTGPVDDNDKDTKPDQDERPTLKRRDS